MPDAGSTGTLEELAAQLGLQVLATEGTAAAAGLFVAERGDLAAHGRVHSRVGSGQHVFFGSSPGRWRYGGRAVRDEETGDHLIDEVDHDTWMMFGSSRSVSRTIPAWAKDAARALVQQAVTSLEGQTFPARRSHCRVLGTSRTGSLRVDGGPDGFKARTVSLTDIGWVLVARQDSPRASEATVEDVNALRYLPGTPRQKTRWVDTELALALARCVEDVSS